MLIETTELDLGNVGLGNLDEVSLLNLFATAQAHRIVEGTGHSLRDITDDAGTPLYPAFFRTRLQIPFPYSLDSHHLWDEVTVGIEVHRFGASVLDSIATLARDKADLGSSAADWDRGDRPSFHGSALFVTDRHAGEPQLGFPKEGAVAALPRLDKSPAEMETLRLVRSEGAIGSPIAGKLRFSQPWRHSLLPSRDLAVGHALMFSRFSLLFDLAERALLTEAVWPPMSREVAQHLRLLDREVYYLGNAAANQDIEIDLDGSILAPAAALADRDRSVIPIAELRVQGTVHQQQSRDLLAVTRYSKLLVVPKKQATLAQDAARFLQQHGQA